MRIALVGFGYWGKNAARAIARVGDFTWIVERDPVARHEAELAWGPWGVRTTDSLQHVVPNTDAVWVATPTRTHFGVVQQALSLGLHVLCEKPFVPAAEEACMLADLAWESRRALMVGHLTIHSDRQRVIRQRAGEFGRAAGRGSLAASAVRNNEQASLSDWSVLVGVGPHEVAPWVAVRGVPEVVFCVGTAHRVETEMIWPGLTVHAELDWLAEHRRRSFTINGQEQEFRDRKEPLLKEAEWFVSICDSTSGMALERDLAVNTTATLEEMERTRAGT